MNRILTRVLVVALILVQASCFDVSIERLPGENTPNMEFSAGPPTVKGGLLVKIGCEDPERLIHLCSLDGYVMHVLDTDESRVKKAREHILSRGLYGKIAVDLFDGEQLPYGDNLVNLYLGPDTQTKALTGEMVRVLAPQGEACFNLGEKNEQEKGPWLEFNKSNQFVLRKPRPSDIDEWTHYLHSPDNNAVAMDSKVAPPRSIQWVGAPGWTRNHHKLNSVSSMVTANGRLFFILDKATASNMSVPGKWVVKARDAFSGVDLWEKSMHSWAFHGKRFRSGPAQVTRLLAASKDSLYLPLGLNEPISRLNAASGETQITYKSTVGAEEMLLVSETLLVLKGEPVADHTVGHAAFESLYESPNKKNILALDADKGEVRWTWSHADCNPMPETLASDGSQVYFQLNNSVCCLDLKTGEEKWTHGDPGKKRAKLKGFGKYVLVVSQGVVLCNLENTLVALSAKDGKKLWQCPGGQGFHAPQDVFVINGLVWTGRHKSDSVSPPPLEDFSEARDLLTGEVKKTNRIMADLQTAGHHHRCYRNKATTKYILQGKRGVEMQDLEGKEHSRNNWIRGTCQYGVMPANGLTYVPPHSCGCYMESKLWGFWAFSGQRKDRGYEAKGRLKKGPAYEEKNDECVSTWSQYRQGPTRSGVAETRVKPELKPVWSTKIRGRLTQATAADNMLILASIDEHTLYALDEKEGSIIWKRTVGGRVDSPPSIYKGLVIFGCADGYVYCLRLKDGELAWRFLAARNDLRVVAYNQVESVWPTRGSVLLFNDTAYCSAGRSTWLDYGMDLYGLDPVTGEVKHYFHYQSEHPQLNEGKDKAKKEHDQALAQNLADYRTFLQPDQSDAFSMKGGCIQDVMVSDGQDVFLHHARFDKTLNKQEKLTRHLFSTSGFLDDTENHRSHWVVGTGDFSMLPVAYSWIVNGKKRWKAPRAVFGLMLVYDDSSIWGIQRKKGYVLFEAKNEAEEGSSDFPQGKTLKEEDRVRWTAELPIRPRALLKAGDVLFIGGMPKDPDPENPHALYEGEAGGALLAVSAKDGSVLKEFDLKAPVNWDGMSAASGKLFVSTSDGLITCYE